MTGIPEHVAKACLGYDYKGDPIESDNPFEIRIRAVNPNISPVERAGFLNSLLSDMTELSEVECSAIVQIMKEHFGLDAQDIKSIHQDLKSCRMSSKAPGPAAPHSQSDLLRKLKREPSHQAISPAQDFRGGVMYYAAKIEGVPYLLTSQRQMISFDEAGKHGLVLRNADVDTCRFSPPGIVSFLEDLYQSSIPDLYEKIYSHIKRFVVFADDRLAVYLSIWVMGTYVFKIFDYYPYVWLNAEKGSGKSLLMRVLSRIAFNGEMLINPTEAVIFRDVANNSVSMFVDEVEQLRKQDKDAHRALISLLNSGFERGSYVKRVEKSPKGSFVIKKYPAYSPKMFAGINEIDDVLLDRTVAIRLLRKKEDEKVERFRESDHILNLQQEIRDDCYLFGLTCAGDLARLYHSRDEEKKGLSHLTNRELDIWEPIMLLADMIDTGMGSDDIIEAMVSLSEQSVSDKQEASISENDTYKALIVIKEMLKEPTVERETKSELVIFKSDLVFEYFKNTDEFSWLQDKSKSALTRRLKRIQVKSDQQKYEGRNIRTYVINLKAFEDLCERFKI